MSDGNPLVADRVDTTSAFAGAFLLQDVEDIANSVSSGDWAAGALAVASTALDTVGALIDPIGTLIANGLGWVLDHIEPLKSWFNDFTGDAAEVASFSGTWGNTSAYLAQLADGYQGLLPQLDGMAGETIDAYLAHANTLIAHLRGASDWSNAMATGLQIASTLVQMVHDIVRDVISQLVGSAISAAATTAATIGFGAPAAMAQFGMKVAGLVAKVGRVISKVLDALTTLLRKLGPLGRGVASVTEFLAKLLRGAPGGHHTTPLDETGHTPTRPTGDSGGGSGGSGGRGSSEGGSGGAGGGSGGRPDRLTLQEQSGPLPRAEGPLYADPTLTKGDGWTRVSDENVSPRDYGLPQTEHGHPGERFELPDAPNPKVQDLMLHPDVKYGWDEHGVPLDRDGWNSRFTQPDSPDGEPGGVRWPGNDGAVNGSRVQYDDMDSLLRDYPEMRNLDRIGTPGGEYLTVRGTPFEQRGLTPGHAGFDYHEYDIVGTLPPHIKPEISVVAPANGFPGGGWQLRFLDTNTGKWIPAGQLKSPYGVLSEQ
ncbi:TNT domain-containing protein [Microbacterium gorillae]|uniref:TNT domain-containing protein n=1 Tax=Microbacterium gorillae TaxID=1231063 RepID=UPI003D9548CA